VRGKGWWWSRFPTKIRVDEEKNQSSLGFHGISFDIGDKILIHFACFMGKKVRVLGRAPGAMRVGRGRRPVRRGMMQAARGR
jgi:hypothetical protein